MCGVVVVPLPAGKPDEDASKRSKTKQKRSGGSGERTTPRRRLTPRRLTPRSQRSAQKEGYAQMGGDRLEAGMASDDGAGSDAGGESKKAKEVKNPLGMPLSHQDGAADAGADGEAVEVAEASDASGNHHRHGDESGGAPAADGHHHARLSLASPRNFFHHQGGTRSAAHFVDLFCSPHHHHHHQKRKAAKKKAHAPAAPAGGGAGAELPVIPESEGKEGGEEEDEDEDDDDMPEEARQMLAKLEGWDGSMRSTNKPPPSTLALAARASAKLTMDVVTLPIAVAKEGAELAADAAREVESVANQVEKEVESVANQAEKGGEKEEAKLRRRKNGGAKAKKGRGGRLARAKALLKSNRQEDTEFDIKSPIRIKCALRVPTHPCPVFDVSRLALRKERGVISRARDAPCRRAANLPCSESRAFIVRRSRALHQVLEPHWPQVPGRFLADALRAGGRRDGRPALASRRRRRRQRRGGGESRAVHSTPGVVRPAHAAGVLRPRHVLLLGRRSLLDLSQGPRRFWDCLLSKSSLKPSVLAFWSSAFE